MTRLARILRRAALVSDPITAGIVVGGAILGIWGGEAKARTNATAATNALTKADDENAIFKANRTALEDKAEQTATSEETQAGGSFNSTMTKLSSYDTQGNQKIAEDVAKASSAEGASLAAAGASGVKNSGSLALGMEQQKANDARTIGQEKDNLNATVSSEDTTAKFSRDTALDTAANLRSSYAVGGDQYNLLNAQQALYTENSAEALTAAQTANSFGTQALTIATGAFSGASSGLSLGNNLNGLFAGSAESSDSDASGWGWGQAGESSDTDWSGYWG